MQRYAGQDGVDDAEGGGGAHHHGAQPCRGRAPSTAARPRRGLLFQGLRGALLRRDQFYSAARAEPCAAPASASAGSCSTASVTSVPRCCSPRARPSHLSPGISATRWRRLAARMPTGCAMTVTFRPMCSALTVRQGAAGDTDQPCGGRWSRAVLLRNAPPWPGRDLRGSNPPSQRRTSPRPAHREFRCSGTTNRGGEASLNWAVGADAEICALIGSCGSRG
jgi:hypothetical protein